MTGEAALRSWRFTVASICAALVALTFVVFEDVRNHEFLDYDDDRYIVDNPLMQTPLDGNGLRAFFRPYHDNWIPLTWLSLRADYALFGPRAGAFLATNVLLHALAAVALFLALARASGDLFASAFCAAVFAVHPLHVESVAWASERKDVLSGLFSLLTVLAYTHYAARSFSLARYTLVTVLFALALLAKPMAVTIPFVLLLLDLFPLRRLLDGNSALRRCAVLEKLPWIAMSAAVAAVAWWVQRESGAMHFGDRLSFAARVANAFESTVVYVVQSVWPTSLSVFYPYASEVDTVRVVACAAIAATVTIGALRAVRIGPHLTVGWLWYVGMLVPVIGVMQVGMQAHADRYMYLPQIGLSIAVVFSGRALADRFPRARVALGGIALASVAAFAVLAHDQVAVWRDTDSLFTHARNVTTENPVAEQQLGSVRLRAGRLAEAEFHFAQARNFAPAWSPAEIGLGEVLTRRGRHAEAVPHYRHALEFDPSRADVSVKLGLVLLALERNAEAEIELRRALERLGGFGPVHRTTAAVAHFGLGRIARASGEIDASLREFARGLELAPAQAQGHVGIAQTFLAANRLQEAADSIATARTLGVDTANLERELASRRP